MRTHETKGKDALFWGDIPGGVEVICECQDKENNPIIIKCISSNKPVFCTVCKEEMFSRPWFSW